MIKSDFHIHTTYCDGKNTPREIVEKALELGMETLGFSEHAPTRAQSSSLTIEKARLYREEINALKEEYRGRLNILCGIEQNYFSEDSTEGYDYVIGSVHFFLLDGKYVPVDWDAEKLNSAADRYFGGDIYALAEAYFRTESQVVEKTGADIIGHFDLISKFIDCGFNIDVNSERYVSAWKKAADRLLTYGKPFEINTGAMSRGYRSSPYPNFQMIDYIKSRGGKLILTSDSHRAATLMYGFDKYEYLL
ncbi:MAG: histidinol-phosphatase [Firmicutes bacterium]|nr:histidinol-phosphatase [Candidatus Colimorpha enterica]